MKFVQDSPSTTKIILSSLIWAVCLFLVVFVVCFTWGWITIFDVWRTATTPPDMAGIAIYSSPSERFFDMLFGSAKMAQLTALLGFWVIFALKNHQVARRRATIFGSAMIILTGLLASLAYISVMSVLNLMQMAIEVDDGFVPLSFGPQDGFRYLLSQMLFFAAIPTFFAALYALFHRIFSTPVRVSQED